MLLHKWIRLERKEAEEALEKIGSKQENIVFSKDLTDVSYKTLPFYTNYKLYKLINYATMPVFTMYYIGNGDDFIAINGLANPIYEANEKDPIHLTSANAVSYLKFFFRYVQGSEGEVFLVTEASAIPHVDSLSLAKQKEILSVFEPLKMEVITGDEIYFKMKAHILYGDALIRTGVTVTVKGTISFDEQEIAVSGITLPNSMYKEREYDFF